MNPAPCHPVKVTTVVTDFFVHSTQCLSGFAEESRPEFHIWLAGVPFTRAWTDG